MSDSAPLIYLVAGEASGDRLGARLMEALRAETDGAVRFRGVGGAMMAAEGLASLFPIADLAVMGFAEVLPRLPRILRRIRETANDAMAARPAAIVTIDSPDFTLRVAKRLSGQGIPLIHYVAPSVWAWKPGRARKIAAYLDRLMTLLPFEPPYFTREGLAADFVGHPVLESGADRGDGAGFRARHGIDPAATLLILLPGSRAGEISHILPILRATVAQLAAMRPNLRLVVPTVDHVEHMVRSALADWALPTLVVTGEREKFDAFAAADAAIAASGTVSLELALAGTPSVIVYRANPLTAAIAKRLVKVKYASLANILLDSEIVPEFLQEECRPERIAATVNNLLGNVAAAGLQRTRAAQALAMLAPGQGTPSRAAARVVLDEIAKKRG
jgi:lipid-A-disaccharide synthase